MNNSFIKKRANKWCISCAHSVHKGCVRKEFDPFEPDIAFTRCKCPCAGEVTEEHPLVAVVADLRQKLLEGLNLAHTQAATISSLRRAEGAAQKILRDFFEQYVDDEGELLSMSKNRRWQNGVEEMRQRWVALVGHNAEESEEDGEESEEDEEWAPESERDERWKMNGAD